MAKFQIIFIIIIHYLNFMAHFTFQAVQLTKDQ